jgi:hypothetical protein
MANTFIKIQTVTVGSGGAASIDFTSIPQTFTDLKILVSGRTLQAQLYGSGFLQFNSDTGSNYKWRRLYGNGSTTASDNSTSSTSITNWDMAGANSTASVFGNSELYIPNYRSANQKSVSIDYVYENAGSTTGLGFVAGLWTNTAAITSIKIYGTTTLTEFSTATLYGIKNT